MNIKILALDFDGTVFDTAYECYVAALKTFNKMGEELEDKPDILEKFMKARVFVKAAGDFYLVLKAIKEGSLDFDKLTQEEFNQKNKELDKMGGEFSRLFYQIRDGMRKDDFDGWIKLHRECQGARETLKQLSRDYRIVVTTTNDKKSISIFMGLLGVKVDSILDKSVSMDKRVHIQIIMDKYKAKPEEVLFIDDILEHILAVKKTGINTVMAGWGYSNQQQRGEAREKGIRVLESIKDLPGFLAAKPAVQEDN